MNVDWPVLVRTDIDFGALAVAMIRWAGYKTVRRKQVNAIAAYLAHCHAKR